MSSLRPTHLSDIIGNNQTVECLKISLEAAKQRNVAFPHTLLGGPSGCGKTTIALAIANELGTNLISANGATVSTVGSLLPYLGKLQTCDVFFVDEAHSIPRRVQECLYTAMEDHVVTVGQKLNPLTMALPPFTLIAATTQKGRLTEPFQNRFKHTHSLQHYDEDDLVRILETNSQKLQLTLKRDLLVNIARRCKGTPRIANSLLEWIRDYIISHKINSVSECDLNRAFSLQGIDHQGLNKDDRKYLSVLREELMPVGHKT